MNEYFFLGGKAKQGTASAYTEGKTPIAHELIPEIITKTELPFILVLKKVIFSKGEILVSDDLSTLKYLWTDYPPNCLAWPLMSEKMKNVIDRHLSGEEGVSWIHSKVKLENEYRNYFIPKFERKLDVLDEQQTTYVAGTSHVIRPVFSRSKIINYNLFHRPELFWEITSGLYVSETLKKAMEKEKLTGIVFETTSVV